MNKHFLPSTTVRPTLLAVLAHPDDESFGMGGTLALYAWCGANVYLVCATDGDVGHAPPDLLQGYASLAERRADELRCAADKLGLTGVEMLDYRDSGMPGTPDNQHPRALAAAPQAEVTERVTQIIRRIRPHVVVTFDPIGGYRHPDHIAIHQATVAAFHAAGDARAYPGDLPPHLPQKLYYTTFPRGLLKFMLVVLRLFGKDPSRFGRNQDVDLVSIAKEHFPIHATIDFLPVEDRKMAAIACHATQIDSPSLVQRIFSLVFRRLGSRETFMRVYPPADDSLREHDLFTGVVV